MPDSRFLDSNGAAWESQEQEGREETVCFEKEECDEWRSEQKEDACERSNNEKRYWKNIGNAALDLRMALSAAKLANGSDCATL